MLQVVQPSRVIQRVEGVRGGRGASWGERGSQRRCPVTPLTSDCLSQIGATLVNTYLYGRCFHALVYLTPSPKFLLPYYTTIRATGFLAATFSMIALAASQL